MKPRYGIIAGGIALIASSFAQAAERTVTLQVDGMTCPSCPYIVTRTLERVDGVLAVEVSFEDRQAVVRFDDETTDIPALTAATANVGFPSRLSRADD